jgi:type I restriction enzyme M protein
MPSGVFQPYAGVGTAVLVFIKGGKTEKVWFCDMKADGYSLDQKRDFIDGKGDIPDIVSKFKAGRVQSDQSILVPFEEIVKNDYNLSISRYKRVEHEEVEYEDPAVLIENVSRLEEEITKKLQELKSMV